MNLGIAEASMHVRSTHLRWHGSDHVSTSNMEQQQLFQRFFAAWISGG